MYRKSFKYVANFLYTLLYRLSLFLLGHTHLTCHQYLTKLTIYNVLYQQMYVINCLF